MSKVKQITSSTMLDLWRPPKHAGDPIGCMTTTYTFSPGLFDEQCLARFLEIESEPDREDLAFLLERESRLGCVYAGVLVDYTQSGVEHSLRWDVLPVRIPNAKQHAKLSLLVWSRHIRIIVSSANLTESGYRFNHEVTGSVEITPEDSKPDMLKDALAFLNDLILFIPGEPHNLPEIRRARGFLSQIESQVKDWKVNKGRETVRQQLVFSLLPAGNSEKRSSLGGIAEYCYKRGRMPQKAQIASPFFDLDEDRSEVTASLCKLMARSCQRDLSFCLPADKRTADDEPPRLHAPKSLLKTPESYKGQVTVNILPEKDPDKNPRPWHAKMLSLSNESYSALMIGSSNFTRAGMGVGPVCNAEANLVTLVNIKEFGREKGLLESVWPEMVPVPDPDAAEWLGGRSEDEEEEQAVNAKLPSGFLSATYHAGDTRRITLRFDPHKLPDTWQIHATGYEETPLFSSIVWINNNSPEKIEIPWEPVQPPEKLLVQWEGKEVFMPMNVEDSHQLPPPPKLEQMTAEDILWILAATDPGAAFRAWAKKQQTSEIFDSDLDSAVPIDLDPLRRYNLENTFLYRIRYRARLFAQLRANLERPVWSKQALEWRLRGLIGVEVLAERLLNEFEHANGRIDENLLTLSDLLIMLNEVNYQGKKGALIEAEYNRIYKPFLKDLSKMLTVRVNGKKADLSKDLYRFWKRVVKQCQK